MGFKDTFVGFLNYAMAKEAPMEDEDYDEFHAMDFDDDFDDDTIESVSDRNSFYQHSDEKSEESDFDAFSEVETSFDEVDDGEDEIFMSKTTERETGSFRTRRYSRTADYSVDAVENDTKDYSKEISKERKGDRKVVSMNNNSNLKVFLANPTAYEDCQDICSRVRAQMTVVVNLEKVKDQNERRRIFDFMSGCSYALDCNFEKISDMIYIIAPCHVDIFEEISDSQQDATISSRRGAGSFSGILN